LVRYGQGVTTKIVEDIILKSPSVLTNKERTSKAKRQELRVYRSRVGGTYFVSIAPNIRSDFFFFFINLILELT